MLSGRLSLMIFPQNWGEKAPKSAEQLVAAAGRFEYTVGYNLV